MKTAGALLITIFGLIYFAIVFMSLMAAHPNSLSDLIVVFAAVPAFGSNVVSAIGWGFGLGVVIYIGGAIRDVLEEIRDSLRQRRHADAGERNRVI